MTKPSSGFHLENAVRSASAFAKFCSWVRPAELKLILAAAIGRPFNPRIRHKLDQPSLQDLAAGRLRSSNPHRSCERRQRLFLNAVSSLGGFRTPASPCLAPPRQRPSSE